MSDMKRIAVIIGVNLGLTGSRETDIYGIVSFEDYIKTLRTKYSDCQLDYFQSDDLSEIVGFLHKCEGYDGIVLNPGAFTHTSMVLADTIKSLKTKVVEVHISNLFGRELFRRESVIAAACSGSISGFGLKGYELAVFSFMD